MTSLYLILSLCCSQGNQQFLYNVWYLPYFPFTLLVFEERHLALFVHHGLHTLWILFFFLLVWFDGDVSHGAELTTVIQMLVLKTEEVPNESPTW